MDIIKKLAVLLPEVIQKLKDEDKDGAVESLEKLADEVNEASEETGDQETEEKPEAEKSSEENKETETEEDAPAETDVEKMIDAKVEAAVKKYVDMYVSAENVETLKDELNKLTEANKDLVAKVEKLGNSSRGSQQLDPVNKTESIWDD